MAVEAGGRRASGELAEGLGLRPLSSPFHSPSFAQGTPRSPIGHWSFVILPARRCPTDTGAVRTEHVIRSEDARPIFRLK